MSVQMCEGVWRNRCGQRLVIIRCDPVDGQRWTDGDQRYSDDGSFYGRYGGESEQDLVEYIGPFPVPDKTAEIDRLRAEWQSEFTAAQQLRSQVEQLERLLDDAREELQQLQADSTAMDHHCMGQKAAFLAVIKTLTGVQS